MTRTVSAVRRDFPYLGKAIWFNHAAFSLLPASVVKASHEGVDFGAEYYLRLEKRKQWVRIQGETRRMAADLLGASAEDVAFTSSTSVGLSLISLAIPWRRGDNVVTGAIENPATVVPWQNLKHLGVEVRFLPADRDDLMDVGGLPDLIDRRTRLVALSLVQYSTGQRMDLARVSEYCRRRGILVSADAVQGAGAVPAKVKALGVHFLAAGAQKWLMGPRHVAVLYVDPAAAARLRSPIVTESNVADIGAEEEQPTSGVPHLKTHDGARKFEAAPYHNFPGVFGLRQALANFHAVGAAALHKRLRAVTDELAEGLGGLGGRVVSPRGEREWSGIVSYAVDGMDLKDLVARLREDGVYIAVRKGRLRISPHHYNTSSDVREFLSVLGRRMRPAATRRAI